MVIQIICGVELIGTSHLLGLCSQNKRKIILTGKKPGKNAVFILS